MFPIRKQVLSTSRITARSLSIGLFVCGVAIALAVLLMQSHPTEHQRPDNEVSPAIFAKSANSTSTSTTKTTTTATYLNEDDEDCPEMDAIGTLVVGSVLTVGIFASYLPQHVAIIKAKSSEGVSLFMLLLSNLSALTIVMFSVMSEWNLYSCCDRVDGAQCQRILLQLYQLLVGFVNLLPMYALAIYYHPGSPRNNIRPTGFSSSSSMGGLGLLDKESVGAPLFPSLTATVDEHCHNLGLSDGSGGYSSLSSSPSLLSGSSSLGKSNRMVDVVSDMGLISDGPSSDAHRVYVEESMSTWQSRRFAYMRDAIIFLIYTIFELVVLIVCLVLVQSRGPSDAAVVSLRGIMGTTGLVSTILIWLPQIYEVYVLKGAGSLSILMLLLQAPGAFAVVIYQGIMEHQQWGVWMPYLAVLVQQCIILGQLLFYYLQAKRLANAKLSPEVQSLLNLDDEAEDISSSLDGSQRSAAFDPSQLVDDLLIDPPSDDDLIEKVFESDDD